MTEKDFDGIVKGGHTHRIESYFAFLLRFRPKNVHFPEPNCRARCDAGFLAWNANPRHISEICQHHHAYGYMGELRYRMEWRERAKQDFYYHHD